MLNRRSFIRNGCTAILAALAICLFSCTSAMKPSEASHEKGAGKLLTSDGRSFDYHYYPVKTKGPTAIYIPGLGGRASYSWPGSHVLASPLNEVGFNYIVFNRADAITGPPWPGKKEQISRAIKRGESGSLYFPSFDGKESGSENIYRNELIAIFEFIAKAPQHDSGKGVFLIGSSFGSWLSLLAVKERPEVAAAVFLSPAIVPGFVETEQQGINVLNYSQNLFMSYGNRPGIAIGGAKDIIDQEFKEQSAFDAANLLRRRIGLNIEVVEVATSAHGEKLIEGDEALRQKIVSWIKSQVR
jgi:pimeloyl-ACP methyl ester carboxylesterase